MKFKKVESIIKERKAIHIYRDGNNDWISDGTAAYLTPDMPTISPVEMLRLFDVSEEKILTFNCKEYPNTPTELNFKDDDKRENVVDRQRIHICISGEVYEPVITMRGMYYINVKYLKPFKGEDFEIYERYSADKKVYFAVKSGMFIMGIIMPSIMPAERIIEWATKIAELTPEEENEE